MGFNKKFFQTGGIVASEVSAAAAFDPLQNFETVTYTGNGGTQKITGYIRKGAAFNGSSSYIATSYTLPSDSTMSFSFWVSVAAFGAGDTYIMSDLSSGATDRRLDFRFNGSGHFVVDVGNGSSNDAGNTDGVVQPTNTWIHFAVVLNGTSLKVYKNGNSTPILDETLTVAFGTAGARSLTFGRAGDYTGSAHLNGKLDQIRIFNKAISSSEVTTLYGETYASSTKSTTDIFNDGSAVALYELDDSANDTGGVSGKFGSAALGFAYDKYITFPDMGGFTSNTSDANGSLSVWFNLNSIPASSSNYYALIDRGNPSSYSSTYQALELLVFGTSNTNEVTFNFRRGFSGTNYDPTSYSATATTLSANTWYHLVVSYVASTKTATFYLDGTSIGSYSLTSAAGGRTIDSGFNIGSYANSSSYSAYAWNGKVDQFRIYSSTLSSTDVSNLYAESNVPTSTLVAYYKLDGDATDETGTYDGTATNVSYAYNGTATNVNYLGMAFQPDFVWIKSREYAIGHQIYDSVRGDTTTTGGSLSSNGTGAEYFDGSYGLTSFDSNGFSLLDVSNGQYGVNGSAGGTYSGTNASYVAWCWKAGGSAVSNTNGTITSQVSANQDAGFSVVKWTAGSDNNATIGHGLSQAPEIVIYKILNTTGSWHFNTTAIDGSYDRLQLNTTNAKTDVSSGQEFTSTTFKQWSYNSGDQLISYCFHSVDGYQKVGSYTGTGVAGNTIVTGFQPRFLMVKNITDANDWIMVDSARSNSNPRNEALHANTSNAEYVNDVYYSFDFLSNGFDCNNTTGSTNASGKTYIYLAIA